MRQFETGATRDTDEGKVDYEACLSPLVIRLYAEYMRRHCIQADGQIRPTDNWQKGIPKEAYIKSLWRHLIDLWLWHRGFGQFARHSKEDALCAILFNASGYLHETLKNESEAKT